MFRSLLQTVALTATVLPPLATADPLSLDLALDQAVRRSESARAARAGVDSARQTERSAGQLPDPMLRAGIENLPVTGPDRLSTARDSQTMKRIGISQEWLSQDKRQARQAVAQALVRRESLSVQAAIAEVRLQTALAYLDDYYATETLGLAVLTEHHVHEELAASQARLAASTGGGADVLALTAAQGLAADESAQWRQQQATARVSLQRWTGLAADELTAPPTLPLPTEQTFVGAAPAVLGLQRDLDVARRSATVAGAERAPNWTWEVSYGQRMGYSDMASVSVSIPLPIAPVERQDRETAAKLAMVSKTEAELAEAVRAATAEYRSLAGDAQRLQDRIERFRAGVVTPAQQRSAVTLAAYRSNQTTLANLLETRHAEVEVQRRLLNLQRDLAKTQAQLALRPLILDAQP